MKYLVVESDEFTHYGEDNLYVFQHTKNARDYEISSLEDFAAMCDFIEQRNTHMYWHKGKDVEHLQLDVNQLEKKFKNEQKTIKPLSIEEYREAKAPYEKDIKPMVLPENPLKWGYVTEPEWNDVFFVAETETAYFALYWFTTA